MFIFGLLLLGYAFVSAVIFLLGAVMMVFPATRKDGLKAVTGVLLSWPGMIVCQIAAFSVAFVLIYASGGILHILGCWESVAPFVLVPILLLSALLVGTGSAYGIYLGHRIAWDWLSGDSVVEMLRNDFLMGRILRLYMELKCRIGRSKSCDEGEK